MVAISSKKRLSIKAFASFLILLVLTLPTWADKQVCCYGSSNDCTCNDVCPDASDLLDPSTVIPCSDLTGDGGQCRDACHKAYDKIPDRAINRGCDAVLSYALPELSAVTKTSSAANYLWHAICQKTLDYGIDKACDQVAAACAAQNSCFPGAATVVRADGTRTRMFELQTGDVVQSVNANGSLSFSPIYFWGHRRAALTAPFTHLRTASGQRISIAADHLIFVSHGGCGAWNDVSTDIASVIKQGDGLWVDVKGVLVCSVVTEQPIVSFDEGVYAPFTLEGTLVVDGVAVSSHSHVASASVFASRLSLTTWMRLYNAALAPMRAAFAIFGPAGAERLNAYVVEPILARMRCYLAPSSAICDSKSPLTTFSSNELRATPAGVTRQAS